MTPTIARKREVRQQMLKNHQALIMAKNKNRTPNFEAIDAHKDTMLVQLSKDKVNLKSPNFPSKKKNCSFNLKD